MPSIVSPTFVSDTEVVSFGWQIDSDSNVALPVNDGSQAKGDVAQLKQCKNKARIEMPIVYVLTCLCPLQCSTTWTSYRISFHTWAANP